jgi:hypothetical protein
MVKRIDWKTDPDNAPSYEPSRAVRAQGRNRDTSARSHVTAPRRAFVKGGVKRGQ